MPAFLLWIIVVGPLVEVNQRQALCGHERLAVHANIPSRAGHRARRNHSKMTLVFVGNYLHLTPHTAAAILPSRPLIELHGPGSDAPTVQYNLCSDLSPPPLNLIFAVRPSNEPRVRITAEDPEVKRRCTRYFF
ncbi:hypothetical protein K438DRAFT_1778745 [Mycena galopus ATCC 62051]|nr:hypothetical protein K438DRAFT_1778745 [Mycena galopus ATCC 62051]